MHVTSGQALRAKRFRTWRSILALVLREMSTTYGKSPGGYVWAIAEPAAAIALLSVAFQVVFKKPSLGTNFPFYFSTGYFAFTIAMDNASNAARAIRFSKSLLAYPGVTWSDAIFARILLSTMTNMLTAFIVISGIILVFDINTIMRPDAIFLALAMAISLGVGIGSMNCYLFTAFPIWERAWAVVTRPLILVSGVIFLYDTMPRVAREFFWYNPLTHVVGEMRKGFFPTYDAAYVNPVYVFSIAFVLWAFGFLLLQRHHKALLNV